MPLWENYVVTVHLSYEVRSGGEFVCGGAAPGDATGTSNREVKGSSIAEAFDNACDLAQARARHAVEASERARRAELGYREGE